MRIFEIVRTRFFPRREEESLLSEAFFKAQEEVASLFLQVDFSDGRRVYAIIGMNPRKPRSRLREYLEECEKAKALSRWELVGLRVYADKCIDDAWKYFQAKKREAVQLPKEGSNG